jgi:hypothetical protein
MIQDGIDVHTHPDKFQNSIDFAGNVSVQKDGQLFRLRSKIVYFCVELAQSLITSVDTIVQLEHRMM